MPFRFNGARVSTVASLYRIREHDIVLERRHIAGAELADDALPEQFALFLTDVSDGGAVAGAKHDVQKSSGRSSSWRSPALASTVAPLTRRA